MKSFVVIAALSLAAAAQADIVAQWNFNSTTPDANTGTGSLLPSTLTAPAASVALLTGNTSIFASGDASGGSSDPATGDDSRWGVTTFAAQGTNSGTRGIQVNVNLTGVDVADPVTLSFDLRFSNTSSRFFDVLYTADSTASSPVWTSIAGVQTGALTGDTWVNNISLTVPGSAGLGGNANAAFRVVAVFAPSSSAYTAAGTSYATSGTWGFDMVTVVPTPGTAALMGMGMLASASRRRA